MHDIDNVWSKRYGYRLSHSMKLLLIGIGSTGVLVILVLGIITLVKQRELLHVQRYEQILVQEVAELDVLNSQKKLLEDSKEQLDKRLSKIQRITCVSKNNPYPYLKIIEKIIPERIILTNFIFDHEIIKLEGLAYTVQEVTKFMRALAQSKLVKSPQLLKLDRGVKKKPKKQQVVPEELVSASEIPEGTVRFVIDVTKT